MEKFKSRKLVVILAYFAVIGLSVALDRPIEETVKLAESLKYGVIAYIGGQSLVDYGRAGNGGA